MEKREGREGRCWVCAGRLGILSGKKKSHPHGRILMGFLILFFPALFFFSFALLIIPHKSNKNSPPLKMLS